jgi:hypothetical protein
MDRAAMAASILGEVRANLHSAFEDMFVLIAETINHRLTANAWTLWKVNNSRSLAPDQFAETNIAAKLTFQGSKIIKGQIRISWPLIFEG